MIYEVERGIKNMFVFRSQIKPSLLSLSGSEELRFLLNRTFSWSRLTIWLKGGLLQGTLDQQASTIDLISGLPLIDWTFSVEPEPTIQMMVWLETFSNGNLFTISSNSSELVCEGEGEGEG